jgi:polysaccharide export outer membrane protein
MKRTVLLAFLICLAAALGSPAEAQNTRFAVDPGTTAEIRIELPPEATPQVSVQPGSRQVLVDLPRGSVFPLDLSSTSNGLLRGGEVSTINDERVQLRIDLASGLLDRIDYLPGSVVLHFENRHQLSDVSAIGADTYLLGPDDKLEITIHNHPELTSTPVVDRDGTISAPLVGDVVAAGLSVRELAVHLSNLLGASYLVDPQVAVTVEDYRSQWVMVTGEVQISGRKPLRGGTRVKEILSEAGGFTYDAGEVIIISRKSPDSEDYRPIRISRADFESGVSNPPLQHGDIIDVPRSEWCYLQGEVRTPGRVRIERGMTLMRAIALSGGLTDWADKKGIKILYPDDAGKQDAFYNLKRIHAGKDPDPELTGGEVIVVGRRFF